MATADLRHRINLHRTKVVNHKQITTLALLLVSQLAWAQGVAYQRRHLERYDDKPIHYGFYFAIPNTRFTVTHSDAFLTADSATRIYSPTQAGFRVGFVVNAFLDDHFDLRFTPGVSLYGREVKYDYASGNTRTETRESTWMEFPLLLKYKSERRLNTRMYLVAGATFGVETNVRRKEVQGITRLSTNTTDLTIDYGIGFEQFFEFFKFTPELRFSHGIPNIFRPTNNAAGIGINRLTTHTVTLYLNFE